MEDLPLETTSFSLDNKPPAQGERRDNERHLTLFRVGALTVDGRRELCLIKNISSGGMLIKPYCTLAAGARVVIELKTGMSVPGRIAWSESANVGVEFDEPVDVVDVLSTGDQRPKPRMPRIEIDCFATVRDGVVVHRLRVCDVSQGGLKLQGTAHFETGNDLTVSLPGLPPQAAALRWSEGGYVGLTFNRLLALPELVEWLRSIRDRSKAA